MTEQRDLETRLQALKAQADRLEAIQRELERDLDEVEHHARRVGDRRERGEHSAELEREARRLDDSRRVNWRDHDSNARRIEGLRREREELEEWIRTMRRQLE